MEPELDTLKSKQHYDNENPAGSSTFETTDTIPFWSKNPNVILHKDYLMEFFPTEDMSFNQKLNAVTRMIMLLTLVTFAYTRTTQILIVGAVSIFFIFLLHQYRKPDEGFDDMDASASRPIDVSPVLKDLVRTDNTNVNDVFQAPTSKNPLGNVLVTDYLYNPKRKPAPPAYNESVSADIVKKAKELVIDANPNNQDIADKLFKDLGDEYMFEQSLRPFYSTASTTIPNDQESFSQFCYGSMVSCKEGNVFACAKNNSTKYNLH